MAGLRLDIEREQDVIAISIRLLTSAATRAVKMPPGLTWATDHGVPKMCWLFVKQHIFCCRSRESLGNQAWFGIGHFGLLPQGSAIENSRQFRDSHSKTNTKNRL